MIETALWIRDYYVCNLSDALRLFMIDKRGLVRQEVLSLGPTPATTAEGRTIQLYVADKGKVEKGLLAVNLAATSFLVSWPRKALAVRAF